MNRNTQIWQEKKTKLDALIRDQIYEELVNIVV